MLPTLALLLLLALGLPAALVVFGFAARAMWTGLRLPDPPPGVAPDHRLRAALWLMCLEWSSTLRVFAVWPLGLLNRAAPGALPGPGQRPVLLLPGYGLTRSSLGPLARGLRRAGLSAVSTWTPPLLAPSRRAATRMAARIRAVSERAGDRRVDLVAFGTSGVLLGEVLASDPDCPIGRVVSLGAPHRGSPMAVYWPGPGAPDLLPDRPALGYWSELLGAALGEPLIGVDADDAPRWVCIDSADDPWIPPECGLPPQGASEVLLFRCGHLRLLHAPAAREAVLDALIPGRVSAPAPAPAPAPASAPTSKEVLS